MRIVRAISLALVGAAVGLGIGVAVPYFGGELIDHVMGPNPNGPNHSMLMLLVAPFTILGFPVVGAALALVLSGRLGPHSAETSKQNTSS